MASDNLNQVGKFVAKGNRKADQALKRFQKKLPVKDRTRDTISSLFPFQMYIETENNHRTLIDINFNKPPPTECAAECFASTCESYPFTSGGHLITLSSPYVAGSVNVYSNGTEINHVQWYEEDPDAGRVYVQVQTNAELIVICFMYFIC